MSRTYLLGRLRALLLIVPVALSLGCADRTDREPAGLGDTVAKGSAQDSARGGDGDRPQETAGRRPVTGSWSAYPVSDPPPPTPELSARGGRLFAAHCAACHGPDGAGGGPFAETLSPPPRDLTSGVYGFKSTPQAQPPTLEDLFRTVSFGLSGSGMPAWEHLLSTRDRWALAYHVAELAAQDVTTEDSGAGLLGGPGPPPTPERIDRGRTAYEELGCGSCHGEEGRGDGRAAAALKGGGGRPVHMPDFRETWQLKRGHTMEDIALAVRAGVPGSPMPSYAEALDRESLWDLAAYVHSLGRETAPRPRLPDAFTPSEEAVTDFPDVPPPVARSRPGTIRVHLDAGPAVIPLGDGRSFRAWSFDGGVPGPMIRARVGDMLEVAVTNSDAHMVHNADFHAVTGPGGGADVLTAEPGETAVGRFRLLYPGLFVYHCAPPGMVPGHIASGMYGLVLVEPSEGLPAVDREYAVLQSEIYARPGAAGDDPWVFSHERALAEEPELVVFNGSVGSLTGDGALRGRVGERVRLYVGNAGPNLVSSFHLIGEIFDRVHREGDLLTPPGRGIQSTLVPAGGAAVLEVSLEVPGTYTLVDHSIFRVEKGAAGHLVVDGAEDPEIYAREPAADEGATPAQER